MTRLGSSLLLIGAVAVLGTQQPAPIAIDYPAEGSIFPPDITAPTFLWRDPNQDSAAWRIDVEFGDGSAAIHVNSQGDRMRIGEIDPAMPTSVIPTSNNRNVGAKPSARQSLALPLEC